MTHVIKQPISHTTKPPPTDLMARALAFDRNKRAIFVLQIEKNARCQSAFDNNENVIGRLKRFKILSDKYRNRRKRFGLRFNLIAGIYNFEIKI
jgi:hypothetical protein